ncbi:PAS domain-containing protein, partial [Acinetobacter baumannii]
GMAHSEIEISTGRFTKVNDRFCRMVGYTFDELIGGMTFLDITHPDDRRATREAIQRLCETEANSVELEKRYLRKDGTVLWVRINSTVVRDSKGNP